MPRKTILGIISVVWLLSVPIVNAEVVNIPQLANIEIESGTDINTGGFNNQTPSNYSSRLSDRVPTNLQFNSTGVSNNSYDNSGLVSNLNGAPSNQSNSSDVGYNIPTAPETNIEYQRDMNVPYHNNSNISYQGNTNIQAPNSRTPSAPAYNSPSYRSTLNTDTIESNARELGHVSSSGALTNAENFRLNAQGQAEGLMNLSQSTGNNVLEQVSRGANYASQGGDEVIDRTGQAITSLGGQIINLLVMGLFYLSIAGAVFCGIRAIVAIFQKDSAWKWVGGAVFSVLIYIFITSITGINIQSNAITDFFNWIINGG